MRYVVMALVAVALVACGGEVSDDEYFDRIGEVMDDTSGAAQRMSDMVEQVNARPALATNSDWEADFNEQISIIADGLDDMRELTPPDSFATAHAAYVRAAECLVDGSEQLRDGYTSNNAGAVARADQFMASCADLWRDAIAEIESLTPAD